VEVRWNRPPTGWIKCNMDGTVSNRDFSRIGLVFRDQNREALLACALKQHGCMAPPVIDALAIWKVVTVARERNFVSVIFESDCLHVIQQSILRRNALEFRYHS
ncbi:hypothetical protein CFOL_v3_13167, partial [Cephalotus follicularis]